MRSCRGLKCAINFPGQRSLPCVLPCRGGLWTCMYLDAHDSAMKFSTHGCVCPMCAAVLTSLLVGVFFAIRTHAISAYTCVCANSKESS
jgi:hypothetical protein